MTTRPTRKLCWLPWLVATLVAVTFDQAGTVHVHGNEHSTNSGYIFI